jgi:hypothetical protein
MKSALAFILMFAASTAMALAQWLDGAAVEKFVRLQYPQTGEDLDPAAPMEKESEER